LGKFIFNGHSNIKKINDYMLNRKFTICIYTLFLFSLNINILDAQDKGNSRLAKRIEPIAKEYFRIGDYKRALEGYLLLDSISPDNTNYNYHLGICYLNSNNKSKAYPYLEFAYNQPDAPANIFLELGQAYHYGHEFEKAMIFYDSYKKQIKFGPDADKKKDELVLIDQYIQMCRNGQRLVRNPLINMAVINLGPAINNEYTDFAPLINANEDMLIFTSKRQASNKKSDPLTDQFYESIFMSSKIDGKWEQAKYIPEPVFHYDIHDAAVGLSPKGDKLFIYRGGTNNFSTKIEGDIYLSNLKSGKWSEPKLIQEINSPAWESHASISADENVMVFTSDREGGFGKTDIYICRKRLNGQWTNPENIGGYINTPYDEDGPFIHPDGNKIYFSSKGHNSMGGFDVFYSEYQPDKQKWTRAVNMGYPINTADDDIYFVWSADGERAYFSSEREDSYGSSDIYMLTRNDQGTPIAEITGIVADKFEKTPVKAELTLRDLISNHLIGVFDTDDQGNFKMNLKTGRKYNVIIRAQGYQESRVPLELTSVKENTGITKNFDIRKK
jgi:tetratricopeptide (TPR) repeat protein